jgi:uncharacterized cupin superfamily protein
LEAAVSDIPGVYRSRIDADRWEPDTEIGGLAHVLFNEAGSIFGLWRSDPDHPVLPVEIKIPARETLVILEGSVQVGIDGTSTLHLQVGDMASVPKGSRITWAPSPDCLVLWSYS